MSDNCNWNPSKHNGQSCPTHNGGKSENYKSALKKAFNALDEEDAMKAIKSDSELAEAFNKVNKENPGTSFGYKLSLLDESIDDFDNDFEVYDESYKNADEVISAMKEQYPDENPVEIIENTISNLKEYGASDEYIQPYYDALEELNNNLDIEDEKVRDETAKFNRDLENDRQEIVTEAMRESDNDLEDEYSDKKSYTRNNNGEYIPGKATSSRQEYNSWYTLDSFKKNMNSVVSSLNKNLSNMSSEDVEEAMNNIKHLYDKTLRGFKKDSLNDELDIDKTKNFYDEFLISGEKILDSVKDNKLLYNNLSSIINDANKTYTELIQTAVNSRYKSFKEKNDNFVKSAEKFISSNGSDEDLDEMISVMRKDYPDEEIIKKLAIMFKGKIK